MASPAARPSMMSSRASRLVGLARPALTVARGGLHEGWLRKQGGGKKSKALKRRWFVVLDNVVYYFMTDTDAEPKGSILLADVTNVRRDPDEKRLVFTIETHARAFVCEADSAKEQEDWIRTLTILVSFADHLKRIRSNSESIIPHFICAFEFKQRILVLSERLLKQSVILYALMKDFARVTDEELHPPSSGSNRLSFRIRSATSSSNSPVSPRRAVPDAPVRKITRSLTQNADDVAAAHDAAANFSPVLPREPMLDEMSLAVFFSDVMAMSREVLYLTRAAVEVLEMCYVENATLPLWNAAKAVSMRVEKLRTYTIGTQNEFAVNQVSELVNDTLDVIIELPLPNALTETKKIAIAIVERLINNGSPPAQAVLACKLFVESMDEIALHMTGSAGQNLKRDAAQVPGLVDCVLRNMKELSSYQVSAADHHNRQVDDEKLILLRDLRDLLTHNKNELRSCILSANRWVGQGMTSHYSCPRPSDAPNLTEFKATREILHRLPFSPPRAEPELLLDVDLQYKL